MKPGEFAGLEDGEPSPLGAIFDGKGVNFALFSAHAERVELCLFDERGHRELQRLVLPAYTDEVFHGYLGHARPGLLYGYRVYGPYAPKEGHRFNHNKLLLDPYARRIVGRFRWSDAQFGYRVGAATADLTFDSRNNAVGMPRGQVIEPAFSWGRRERPRTDLAHSLIYECHVKGFTSLHPDVLPAWRGTVLGLASDAAIEHLLKLGVTAVELLPVHYFLDDRFLVERGLRNYWGYNTLGYFAPAEHYLAGGGIEDFKVMVRRLHAAGIQVILDVVYNHTAEGNELGPTLSFKGIDNKSYYRLLPDEPRYYINETGTGNSFNLIHPRTLQLVMDSLRYWVDEMGVDGFRFDLATTVGRETYGFDPGSGFFDAVRQDPAMAGVTLIAEPWDIGPGGYQLGNFPPGWSEWNDDFRDTVRRYWRGDEGMLPRLAGVISGCAARFDHRGRRPQASVNYVASHDGFTLHDLVSYENRHNEANGEDGGHEENYSANHGVEGPTDDAEVLRVRERQKRNLLLTLFLSQGLPMILMGDERGRSQAGNNNAYCQDNEISWLDWAGTDDTGHALERFVGRLMRLRREHPALRAEHFLHGQRVSEEGIPDIHWLHPSGRDMGREDWEDPEARALGMLLNGRVASPASRPPEAVLLAWFNAGDEPLEVMLPEFEACRGWRLVIDTVGKPEEVVDIGASNTRELAARSVSLYVMIDRHGQLPERL